jgi:hypothetical protein
MISNDAIAEQTLTITESVLNAATKELENAPVGLRFTELVQRVKPDSTNV